MLNNVFLDVAIGIVFIFLLYSLLATSIQEAIATALALRARNLKDGIINGMLSDTPSFSKFESILRGVAIFFKNIFHLFFSKPDPVNKKLGQLFYDHPLIKNYGSSRIFPNPSYLPTNNFSSILIDILKQDFDNKIDAISEAKSLNQVKTSQDQIKQNFQNSPDAIKLKELLSYYGQFYAQGEIVPDGIIDKDTWQILQMHLRNSLYSIDDFTKKLETWYDDSMNRVSGWYKRQVQVILFIIGLLIALVFNVDIIQIEGKLSTDKDARDQMVQLAVKEADAYKDDPRVKGTDNTITDKNQTQDSLYQQHIKEARKIIDTSIVKPNQLMALGWGDYGEKTDSAQILALYFKGEDESAKNSRTKINRLQNSVRLKIDTLKQKSLKTDSTNVQNQLKTAIAKLDDQLKLDTNKIRKAIVDSIYDDHPFKYKVPYVLRKLGNWEKLLGLLITAFGICLGAPFWFDLLNKLINLRGAGKQEGPDNKAGNSSKAPEKSQVNVNLNTQQSSEEAVG